MSDTRLSQFVAFSSLLSVAILVIIAVLHKTEAERYPAVDAKAKELHRLAVNTVLDMEEILGIEIRGVLSLLINPTIKALGDMPMINQDEGELLLEDQRWKKLNSGTELADRLLESSASKYLKSLVANYAVVDEILVTDATGRLVAASGPTTDYYQADEAWWTTAAAARESSDIFISGLHYDRSAGVHALEVSAALRSEERLGEFVGVVKVLLNGGQLTTLLRNSLPSATAEAYIIEQPTATIVASHKNDEFLTRQDLPFDEINLAIVGDTHYFSSNHRVFGLASFREAMKNNGWILAISDVVPDPTAGLHVIPHRAYRVQTWLLAFAAICSSLAGLVAWLRIRNQSFVVLSEN